MTSLIKLLPFTVNQNIVSFLNGKQIASAAIICKDFYKIMTNLAKHDFNQLPVIELCLNDDTNKITVTIMGKDINYQTLQRILNYNRKIKCIKAKRDIKKTTLQIPCNKLLNECRQLIFQCRVLVCHDAIWFMQFRNYNINFSKLQCLHYVQREESNSLYDYFKNCNKNNNNNLVYFYFILFGMNLVPMH